MKRKQLKIKWEFESIPTLPEGEVAIPNREPDYIGDGIHYWFNEMRSAGFDADPKQEKRAWVMDECPRTGALMTMEPQRGRWHIQPKAALEAYHTWLAEHFFME